MADFIKMSKLFIKTFREDPSDAEIKSHKLLLRAGYIKRISPGIYSWLPLGIKVKKNIENIIHEEMHDIEAQEVHFPALLPKDPYKISGRWNEYGDNLFKLKDRRNNNYLLAPTHEEMFTLLVKDFISSYNDLPLSLYQIQNKYRDEIRSRGGLLRSREFTMKDAYTFDIDNIGLDLSYQKMRKTYINIFQKLELDIIPVQAVSGAMGGSYSEEFLHPTRIGEDKYIYNEKGVPVNVETLESKNNNNKNLHYMYGIEVGHIFKLGSKYSEIFNLIISNKNNQSIALKMGSYGIGVTRTMAAIAEKHNDDLGLCWPKSVAPAKIHILPIGNSEEIFVESKKLALQLADMNIDVIFDDRTKISPGVKFSDADLLGVPYILIVGKKLKENKIELKDRAKNIIIEYSKNNILATLESIVNT